MSGGTDARPLDPAWLRCHPLPDHPEGTDKNSRGRVMLVGGSTLVPGGLILTATAAFRAGAGKVQVALPEPLAIPTGIAVPEAGVLALPADEGGEIADAAPLASKIGDCGCLVLGPAMASADAGGRVMDALLPAAGSGPVVMDAACIEAAASRLDAVAALPGGAVLTPHAGEMARLTGLDPDEIEARRAEVGVEWAARLRAVIAIKGSTTLIASPDGEVAVYAGGGVGLATGGSGDVLAGLIAGLVARGLPGWEAACWGVWLHGEAGRRMAERMGPVGFLARELAAEVPGLMRGA